MPLLEGYNSESDSDSKIDAKAINLPDISINFNPEVELVEDTIAIKDIKDVVTNKYQNFEAIHKRALERRKKPKNKKKRKVGNVEDDYLGPWAEFESDAEFTPVLSQTQDDLVLEEEFTLDVEAALTSKQDEPPQVTSEYFATFEYKNSFLQPPSFRAKLNKRLGLPECFVPKKVIHEFSGHEKGVSKLEFFPVSGHLLLSAGNDSIIRLWDLRNKKELIREYYGHLQSVKDVHFNSTGHQFLSCSFDKRVHLWDTETGEILKTLIMGAIPTVVKFVPGKDNEILVGLMNSNIEHYDLNDLGKPLQTYDHHVGCINALCMIDEGTKFLSTSDDKCIRIWNWGINIPVKTITHPTQYAISSAVAIPPSQDYIALQNMNNSIQFIDGKTNYKFKSKKFRNDNVTGHKVEIDVSPDGKIVTAGDSKGFILFWDFKSGKLVTKLNVSDRLINTVKYHPQEPSKVAAGGMNGKIYYCD